MFCFVALSYAIYSSLLDDECLLPSWFKCLTKHQTMRITVPDKPSNLLIKGAVLILPQHQRRVHTRKHTDQVTFLSQFRRHKHRHILRNSCAPRVAVGEHCPSIKSDGQLDRPEIDAARRTKWEEADLKVALELGGRRTDNFRSVGCSADSVPNDRAPYCFRGWLPRSCVNGWSLLVEESNGFAQEFGFGTSAVIWRIWVGCGLCGNSGV
jgi:hypothetical protein